MGTDLNLNLSLGKNLTVSGLWTVPPHASPGLRSVSQCSQHICEATGTVHNVPTLPRNDISLFPMASTAPKWHKCVSRRHTYIISRKHQVCQGSAHCLLEVVQTESVWGHFWTRVQFRVWGLPGSQTQPGLSQSVPIPINYAAQFFVSIKWRKV